jgi:hypothetical protein
MTIMDDVHKLLDEDQVHRGRRKCSVEISPSFFQVCLVLMAAVAISFCAIDAYAISTREQDRVVTMSSSGSPEGSPNDFFIPSATIEAQQATLNERVQTFVRIITRNVGVSSDESLIRWNTPICFVAAGWRPEVLATALTRLSQISSSAGAPLARKPCTPNFVVVATADPDQVIRAWYAKDRQLFGNASPLRIRHFLDSTSSRPVRTWRNIDVGRVATTRFGHFVPSNSRADPSPFVGNVPLGFLSIFELIDTSRTPDIDLNPLIDYVAMMGLSNIDTDVDVGTAPSILQLFSSERRSVLGFSNWDSAFLTALYQTDQMSRSQRFEIAKRVAEAATH